MMLNDCITSEKQESTVQLNLLFFSPVVDNWQTVHLNSDAWIKSLLDSTWQQGFKQKSVLWIIV